MTGAGARDRKESQPAKAGFFLLHFFSVFIYKEYGEIS